MIYREADENDARWKKIIVSEKALQYKDIVMADILNLEKELTQGISENDLDVFSVLLKKCLLIFPKTVIRLCWYPAGEKTERTTP